MASQSLLKQIHTLVKKGFPNATYVSITVTNNGLTVNSEFSSGRKALRARDINGNSVDECPEQEE